MKKERASTKAKKSAFLKALKKTLGIIAPAMEAAGIVERRTISRWRKEDEDFAAAMLDIQACAGDFVESRLLSQIKDGQTSAIIFYCKTKLKHRGYTERTEITGADGASISSSFQIEIIDNRDKVENEDTDNGNL